MEVPRKGGSGTPTPKTWRSSQDSAGDGRAKARGQACACCGGSPGRPGEVRAAGPGASSAVGMAFGSDCGDSSQEPGNKALCVSLTLIAAQKDRRHKSLL